MSHDGVDQRLAADITVDNGHDPDGTLPAASDRHRGSERRSLIKASALFVVLTTLGLGVQAGLSAAVAVTAMMVVAGGVALLVASRLDTAAVAGLVWLSLCSAVTTLILQVSNTQQHTLSLGLFCAAVGGVLIAAVPVGQRVRAGASLRATLSEVSSVLTVPSTDFAAVLIGAGTSMSLVGHYSPVVVHPDSAWFVASTRHVQENGVELLQRTQDVWLPHLTIGPLIAIDGYRAAVAFVIVTMMLLVSLTSYVAYRLTGRGAAGLAAAAVLLASPTLLDQVNRLPLYASVFFFAYGSLWLLHRSMLRSSPPWWWPVLAGLGFVLAYESHGIGQLFLITPCLLLILHPWARARGPLLVSLATTAIASIPRAVLNYSEGGFTAFRSNYTDFFIQNYIDVVNQDFWGFQYGDGAVSYLSNIPTMLGDVWGQATFILLLAIPVIFALRHSKTKAVIFAAGGAGFLVVALAIQSPAPYARYVLPIIAGIAIAVGVGIGKIVERSPDLRFIGGLLVLAVSVAAIAQIIASTSDAAEERRSILAGPTAQLTDRVDDESAAIGVRSHQLARTDSSLVAYNWRLMYEEDWVTYLSWPSDREVVEMLESYDIGWVYLMPQWELEVGYHQTWLEPAYGLDVVHDQRIAESTGFCLVAESEGNLLYRMDVCAPGDLQRDPQEMTDGFSAAALGGDAPVAADAS